MTTPFGWTEAGIPSPASMRLIERWVSLTPVGRDPLVVWDAGEPAVVTAIADRVFQNLIAL